VSQQGVTLTTSGTAGYGRRGLPSDQTSQAARAGDRMEIQAKFQGVTAAAAAAAAPESGTVSLTDLIVGDQTLVEVGSIIRNATSVEGFSDDYGYLTGPLFSTGAPDNDVTLGIKFVMPATNGGNQHLVGRPTDGIVQGTRLYLDTINIFRLYITNAAGSAVSSQSASAAGMVVGNAYWAFIKYGTASVNSTGLFIYDDNGVLVSSSSTLSGVVHDRTTTDHQVGIDNEMGAFSEEMLQINSWTSYLTSDQMETIAAGTSPESPALQYFGLVGGAANGAPHVMQIDDGERACGLSVSDDLSLVHPTTGAVLKVVQAGYGWTSETSLRLVKRESTSWDVYADGRLLYQLPYLAAPESVRTTPWYQFGTVESGVGSVARWAEVETATNASLAPHWKVDRARLSMPVPIQDAWNDRWAALTRAVVGLQHTAADVNQETYESLTGGLLWLESATYSGEIDLDDEKDVWEKGGTDAVNRITTVREYLRIIQSVNPVEARFNFSTPMSPAKTVMHVRATVRLSEVVADDPRGRLGPYLTIANGHRLIRAVLVQARDNPNEYSWMLSDGGLNGALGNTGARGRVEPFEPHVVDFYIVERDAVVLAVDGWMVDVQPYATFTGSTSDYYASTGRDGANDPEAIRAVVDYEDVTVRLGYADQRSRPWLQQRISERLIFAGGCEPNALLQVLANHGRDVMKMRGTLDGVLAEARRLACDANVEVVRQLTPADWYLEVTWPEQTPIFLEANGLVEDLYLEHADNAPNFTPAELSELFSTYILPLSTLEAQFYAPTYTLLTSATVTAGTTTFDVADPAPFADGDLVTLREETSGTITSIEFDADADLTATDVHNFARSALGLAAGHGTFFGSSDGAIENETGAPFYYTANMAYAAASSQFNVPHQPTIAAGFTVHAKILWKAGGTTAIICASTDRNPKGFNFARQSGDLDGRAWSTAGTLITASYAGSNFTDGEWYDVTWVVDATNAYLYVNGVEVASDAPHGTTPGDCTSSGMHWLGDGLTRDWDSDARDLWYFERALSPAEVAALAAGERIDDPRDFHDTALVACHLPTGWSALQCTHEDLPHTLDAPDNMELSAFDDVLWAEWRLRVDGMGDSTRPGSVVSELTLPALDADLQNIITVGETVTVEGFNATVNCVATVWGLDDSNDPASERFVVVAGVAVVGATLWNEVHGMTIDSVQTAAVRVFDTSDLDQLFVVSASNLSSGVYFWPSHLLAGPSTVRAASDGATTDSVLVFGVEEGAAFQGEELVLAGTAEVETVDSYDLVQVISASYVPTGQTLTVNVLGVDPAGTIQLVSNSAFDTMDAYVLSLDSNLQPQIEKLTLNGFFPVTGTQSMRKLLGVYLATEGTGLGTLTVSNVGGVVTINHGTLVLSVDGQMFGGAPYNFANEGSPSIRLSQPQSTVRYVGVLGLRDGAYVLASLALDGTEWVDLGADFDRILGVATGNVPPTKWILAQGRAWRGYGVRTTELQLDTKWRWAATSGTSSPDVVADNLAATEATLGPVAVAGIYSVLEDTTITTIDSAGAVETPALNNSFGIGARMRTRE